MIQRLKEFFLRRVEVAAIALLVLGIVLMALLVQNKFAFLNYFFLPVILAAYVQGKNRGVLTALLSFVIVVLYLIYSELIAGPKNFFLLHETINLVIWGSFLILTGALIGSFSEQRESKIEKLRNAYVGTLEIMLKYLESADEAAPPAVRVARIAGRIAAAAGLERHEIENIKSASLLSMAGDLSSSLPMFVEMTDFLSSDEDVFTESLGDREKVMLKSTSSILKEIRPLLRAFHRYYVREGDNLDKDLEQVPLGSGIMALAQVYDKIGTQSPPFQDRDEFRTLASVQGLSGKTFHTQAIEALLLMVSSA
jgi:hypothetical protein